MTGRSWLVVVGLALLCSACGGSTDLKVSLAPGDGEGAFALVNRSDGAWDGARVRVTGDGPTATCFDQAVASWPAGEARSFPRCGDRTVIALEVDGARADLVLASGTLYRKLGRREIPIRG